MMRKFLLEKQITHSECLPVECYRFLPYITKRDLANHVAMPKMQMVKVLNDLNSLDLDFSGCETPLSILRVASLTNQEFDHLEVNVRTIYKEKTIIRISGFVKSMWRLQVGNEIVTTESYRCGSSFSNCILGKWFGREYENNAAESRPAFVSKILELAIVGDILNEKVYVAKVNWLNFEYNMNRMICVLLY